MALITMITLVQLFEICERYELSPNFLSRYINNHPNNAPSTTKLVLDRQRRNSLSCIMFKDKFYRDKHIPLNLSYSMFVLAVDLSLLQQKPTLEEKLGFLASLKSRWEHIQTHVYV